MFISLVIPTYNRREQLKICLEAAVAQDYESYEVIVVDDCSTDGSPELIKNQFPQVKYIRQARNAGPAAARNAGIDAARGEIVAFTDDDCQIPPDFLSALVAGYRDHPEVAGVGGYQEAADEKLRTSVIARYESFLTHQVYHVGEEEVLGGFDCPAWGTNSISYRKALLQAVGGFDPSFPIAAGEDAFLKLKIVNLGYNLLFKPVKVLHHQPYTFQSFWRQQIRRGMGEIFFQWRTQENLPSWLTILSRPFKRFIISLIRTLKHGLGLALVENFATCASFFGQIKAKYQIQTGNRL